jgi:hypothetical protein
VSADLIRRMVEAGTPADIIADVALALAEAAAAARTLEQRRAKDRARKTVPGNSTESEENAETSEIHGTPSTPAPSFPQTPNQPHPHTPEKTNSRARGTRLDPDFELPIDWRNWAIADRGWSERDAAEEGRAFADYWHAKAGKDGIKLDWPATWRNWCRNSRRPPPGRLRVVGREEWISPC